MALFCHVFTAEVVSSAVVSLSPPAVPLSQDVQQGDNGRKYAGEKVAKRRSQASLCVSVLSKTGHLSLWTLTCLKVPGVNNHDNGGKCHHLSNSVHPVRVDVPVINQKVFVVHQIDDEGNL